MRRIRVLQVAVVVSTLVLGLAGATQAAAGSAPGAAASDWTTTVAPTPTRPDGELDALSCPTSRWCMAVGSYVRPDGGQLPGAVERTDTGWVRRTMPAPAQVTSVDRPVVSCSGPGHCLAVVHLYLLHGWRWLAESWNGRHWQPSISCTVRAMSETPRGWMGSGHQQIPGKCSVLSENYSDHL